jgi:DNA-directed RNA polymerase subunit E'/Rpb7
MYRRRNLTKVLKVPTAKVGKDIQETLLNLLQKDTEGICLTEGYVRPDSIKINSLSLGRIHPVSGHVMYEVGYSADILFPAEGLEFTCKVKSVMKMGVRGTLEGEIKSPFDVLIPRDHYVDDPSFQALKVGDIFQAKVIGHRYQYGDKEIFVLAEIVKPEVTEEPTPGEDEERAVSEPNDPNVKSIQILSPSQNEAAGSSTTGETKTISIDESSAPAEGSKPKRRAKGIPGIEAPF